MDITIPVLLLMIVSIMIVSAMSVYCLFMFASDPIVKKDREKERIRRRKLKTPPCSKCMRGFLFLGQWHCNCNEYKEQVERLTTKRPEYVSASEVRGTKWCRYEPGLEDGEGI